VLSGSRTFISCVVGTLSRVLVHIVDLWPATR
jgi:hypothetical protein